MDINERKVLALDLLLKALAIEAQTFCGDGYDGREHYAQGLAKLEMATDIMTKVSNYLNGHIDTIDISLS
jgi:hypothetical protein